MPVVTVKEAPCLMTVYRVIRGIHIQDNLLRRRLMRLQKYIHQQRIHRHKIRHYLLVTVLTIRLTRRRQLQPIQRAIARQRLTPSDARTRPAPVISVTSHSNASNRSRHNSADLDAVPLIVVSINRGRMVSD